MAKTRYIVIESKVRRKSSAVSYDRYDCRITAVFGGWEPHYTDSLVEARLLALAMFKKMNERDQYSSVFEIETEEYNEENECWEPGIEFHTCDFWMGKC